MKKTRSLELLCYELSCFDFDWDAIANDIVPRYYKDTIQKKVFLKDLSETSIDHFLIALKNAWKKPSITLNPMPDNAVNCHYYFQYKKDKRLVARNISNNHPHAEYDNLIMLGPNPVVFEIKMGIYKANNTSPSIYSVLDKNKVQQKIMPIRNYYKKEPGYVMITPKSTWYPKYLEPDDHILDFEANGGIFTPYPIERKEFRRLGEAIAKKYRIELIGE